MVYIHPQIPRKPSKGWRWASSSHLIADDLEELHRMARLLGLKEEWFQKRNHPHYDVSPLKHERAIRLGAVLLDRRAFTRKLRSLKGKKHGRRKAKSA